MINFINDLSEIKMSYYIIEGYFLYSWCIGRRQQKNGTKTKPKESLI